MAEKLKLHATSLPFLSEMSDRNLECNTLVKKSFRLCINGISDAPSSAKNPMVWKTDNKVASKQTLAITKVNAAIMVSPTPIECEKRKAKSRERKTPSFYTHYLDISTQCNPLKDILANKGFRTKEERNLMAYSKTMLKQRQPSRRNEKVVKVIDISKPVSLCARFDIKPLSVK